MHVPCHGMRLRVTSRALTRAGPQAVDCRKTRAVPRDKTPCHVPCSARTSPPATRLSECMWCATANRVPVRFATGSTPARFAVAHHMQSRSETSERPCVLLHGPCRRGTSCKAHGPCNRTTVFVRSDRGLQGRGLRPLGMSEGTGRAAETTPRHGPCSNRIILSHPPHTTQRPVCGG